jgi:ribosomal protein S15P/S13E
LVANLKGAPGSGRRILFLAASGVGVMVLAALAVAVVLGSGKKRSGPDQKRAAVPTVVGAERAAAPAKPATGEKPALPTAVVEPVKPQPAAEEKPLAPAKSQPAAAEKPAAPAEKPAAPAEKPTAPEKPAPAAIPAAEKPRPVEKKVAAEKVAAPVEKPAPPERPAAAKPVAAPKPAVEKPAAAKVRTAGEPAAPRPEKKPAEVATPAAKPATNQAQEAAEAYQRGNAKLLSGALPEAIAAFSEALKLNPKDAQSQRGLGMAYAQAGNAAKAVRHLKLYLKASPNAPDRALIEKRIDQLGGR